MHAAQDTSMVAEVVAHGLRCLLSAMGRQSLEAVQQCAVVVVQAVTHARHGRCGSTRLPVRGQITVLRSLVPAAVDSVFIFLQRLHASPNFGEGEHSLSTTLINLVFCAITLLRLVGSDLRRQPKQEQQSTGDAALSLSSGEIAHLMGMHAKLQDELNTVLTSHFSLIVYNAEHQLWQLETAASSEDTLGLPELHAVPHTTLFLQPADAWIWLMAEATTSGVVTLSPTSALNSTTQMTPPWLTRAFLSMNSQDTLDASFAQKFMSVVLSLYALLLKRWMRSLPGLAEALQRWGNVDGISFFDLTIPFSMRHWETSNRNDLTILAEICVVLHDLICHVPVIFDGTKSLLQLQRVLSQLSVVRFFFAAQRPLGASSVADGLSVELSRLLEAASEHVFFYLDHSRCAQLPHESSLPHLQLAFFDLASYTFERHAGEDTAFLALVRPPSVCEALNFASMVRCFGSSGSMEGVGAQNGPLGVHEDIATSRRSASFAQSIVLAFEEVFFCLCAFGCLVEEAPSLYLFFESVSQTLRGAFAKSQVPTSLLASSCTGSPLKPGGNVFSCVLTAEAVKAVEDVVSLYTVRVQLTCGMGPGDGALPKHRRYWMLAVSHLRMADFESQAQMAFGVVLGSAAEYSTAFFACSPSGSREWLQLDDGDFLCEGDDSAVLRLLSKQRALETRTHRMSNFSSTIRERLVAASMRFLLLALREAVLFEEAMEYTKMDYPGGCSAAPLSLPSATAFASALGGELSQSSAYATAFTRFLLMMEYIPSATVVKFSEMCCRSISEFRPTVACKTSSHGMVTEADVLAALSYQLSLSFFTA
ncbi:hypothetical protein TraAM80_02738 [Trypanosoma rangeli]|uniref:Uncharacterized protein n=1 Tax=Trypanosoma rangeli TaxID=5698 RepID=A0A422NSJ5_TRYRA|nr:uncharacterized protein TraAM80_02738 [Trypanosoma rangeli]RNF08437.1 hypothetical protein TraAM80_02738 [Trypanosoma rangeli]|eukprot:RNF08437.1 hypothetical protein TraAM80_02738 [Trypanosoma rangeli]